MIQVLTPWGDDDTSSIRAVIAVHPSSSQRSVDLPTTASRPQGPDRWGRPYALWVKAIAEFATSWTAMAFPARLRNCL
jgi:hypothetical protein